MKKVLVVSFVALTFAAGCGSSSDGGGASAGSGGASGGSGGGASSGGSGGGKDANAVCGAIAVADVQALYTSTVSGHTFNQIGGNFACHFELTDSAGKKDTTTQVNLYVSDPDEKNYSSSKTTFPNDTFYDLSGVGDKAYWFQAIDGLGVPAVMAHKKDASCSVHVADALENTTCKYTGAQNVSKDDGAAYALLMGKLCDDVFTGYGD